METGTVTTATMVDITAICKWIFHRRIINKLGKGVKQQMEIKTTITEAKGWIRGNKFILIMLFAVILAITAGAAYYINSHKGQLEHISQFPAAAVSADVSAARTEDLIQDINRQRSQEEEVVRSAKKKAVKVIADLDNDAVAAAWNSRIGEYRESRKNQNGSAGNDSN